MVYVGPRSREALCTDKYPFNSHVLIFREKMGKGQTFRNLLSFLEFDWHRRDDDRPQ